MGEEHEYASGTHLAARRSHGLKFDHHGIAMGDGQVFELAKSNGKRATLRLAPFEIFAAGGDVREVEHGRSTATDTFKPLPADPPEVVLDRINRLLRVGELGDYDLWGLNCEHVANFCMTGVADSPQVRQRWFMPNAMLGGAVMLWFADKVRQGRVSTSLNAAVALFVIARTFPGVRGHLATWRFTALIARVQPPGSI